MGRARIADEMNNRYLFYSDVTETSLNWHLDVPSWLGLLKSYAHLPTQIAYIDACANLKPNWNLWQQQNCGPAAQCTAMVFFAAAIGQRAANQSVLRSGKFSKNLRK